jgi:molybdate transport system ATP-binding protein
MTDEALDARFSLDVGTLHIDVAFRVERGMTILFGPSGAGKSSLLASVAGLVTPKSGRIALGADVWFDAALDIDVPPHRRGISLVFQSLALLPHLSSLGNVVYGIDPRLGRKARREMALSMLERMKVAHVADRRPATLSGGEAQRVALARAFARNPRLVLLDEAFSALDRDLRYELGAEVRSMVEERKIPVLLVTHHRLEARAVGERALLLRDGRIEASGPVRDVVPAPEREV